MSDEIEQLRGKVRFINDIMEHIEVGVKLSEELDEHTEICAISKHSGKTIDIERYSDDLFNILLDMVPKQLAEDIKILKETIK